MDPLLNTDLVWSLVSEKARKFHDLSDRVWAMPELNYEEFRSSEEHAAMLRDEGFRVTRGVGGLPTAVMGEAGEGGPVIAFLGEFDALPALSQEAGLAEQRPLESGGNGHGCGHNLLGAGALQAATAVKDWLARTGRKGRVRYYGCPAEEGGSGKGYMVRAGAFADVDAAITWHPSAFSGICNPVSLACNEMSFTFVGRSSHAAIAPHLGRSALDAVELMNVGVNYMREHMPSRARIHYAITDAGGNAPNVVQGRATVRYVVRGGDVQELDSLVRRVNKIAEGAALMTETTVTSRILTGEANRLGNSALEQLMYKHLQRLGPPVFDDADHAFAARIQQTFTKDEIASAYRAVGMSPQKQSPLCDFIYPPRTGDTTLVGSSDVGNVSWVVPTVELRCATYAIGTPAHSWQLVAQGKAPAAHKGMDHAATVMASTAVELLSNPSLIEVAKKEHRDQLEVMPFVDPIPPGSEPEFPLTVQVIRIDAAGCTG